MKQHSSNQYLSDTDIKVLKEFGFEIDDSNDNSGLYVRMDEYGNEFAIVHQGDFKIKYKLEKYSPNYDNEHGHYEDYDKFYSNENETLKEFLDRML